VKKTITNILLSSHLVFISFKMPANADAARRVLLQAVHGL